MFNLILDLRYQSVLGCAPKCPDFAQPTSDAVEALQLAVDVLATEDMGELFRVHIGHTAVCPTSMC